MTDDRAERIRRTRNRFRPNGGDETEETTVEESADSESGPASTDETGTDSQPDEESPRDDEPVDEPEADTDDEDYPSLDDLNDGGEANDAPEGGSDGEPAGDTEVTYSEADTTGDATSTTGNSPKGGGSTGAVDAGGDTMNVPEIDASVDTDGEPTVDASAIATEDDTYDQTVVSDDRDTFVDNDALARSAHRDENTVQVLEFFLNDDRFAVEIEKISAIVEMKDITRFPRGPEAIDGVTDLRGEITAILDPTAMLDVERSDASEEHYIVVLKRSEDKQKLGIRVTDVSQAVTYHESQIDETSSAMSDGGVADGANAGGVTERGGDHEFVKGIIKKTDDGTTSLVAWLDVDEVVGRIE